uniref:Transmembrane protein 234 homolog n=1 Tax=Parastrongyloides trichosuri TaxID=131310 RepID=A0A0N4ZKT4_PARTI
MFALINLFYIVLVSFIWGTSNPFIRKGTLYNDNNKKVNDGKRERGNKILESALNVCEFITNWRFFIPFLINQIGSIFYNILLISMPITIVVPMVNSLTFFFTALVGSYVDGSNMSIKQWFGVIILFIGNALVTYYD